ncbi:MAG: hypothetical protein Roseis2KO_53680 [Roseivirga sp.]
MHPFKENLYDTLIPNIQPKERHQLLSALLIDLNAFVSIEDAEVITTLDKTTQYRLRKQGHFPSLIQITPQGRRKGYRMKDLKKWLVNPLDYHRLSSN